MKQGKPETDLHEGKVAASAAPGRGDVGPSQEANRSPDGQPVERKKETNAMGTKGKIAVVVLGSAMVIGACALPSLGLMEPSASPTALPLPTVAISPTEQAPIPVPVGTGAVGVEAFQNVLEAIYRNVSPSVVTINVTEQGAGSGQGFFPFFGQSPPGGQPQQGLGSGFVWDNQGDIVTNNHVIEGAATITVSFSDGTEVPGKLIGADPNSDLAVVRVNVGPNLLHPVQTGDSSRLQVGQIVIAIGNPFGEQNTMTEGSSVRSGGRCRSNGGPPRRGPTRFPTSFRRMRPSTPGIREACCST